jgi:hypothetical protein
LAQYTELIFSTLPLLAPLLSAAAIEVVTAYPTVLPVTVVTELPDLMLGAAMNQSQTV